jgi:hypothetical protein
MAIGEVEIDGESRFFTSSGKEVLLCNTWHPIPEDYELDLVDHLGFEFDRVAAAAFEEMVSDAEDADIDIEVNNGYRAKWLQQRKALQPRSYQHHTHPLLSRMLFPLC